MPRFISRSFSSRIRYVLDRRALLVAAEALEPRRLAEIGAEPGETLVGLADGSSPSLLLSAELAALVERFRRPRTAFEAAAELAERRGAPAVEVLEGGQDALRELFRRGILRDADVGRGGATNRPDAEPGDSESRDADATGRDAEPAERPLFAAGARPIPGARIEHLVHRLDGREIYLVALDGGGRGALKVQRRPSATGDVGREIAALARLAAAGSGVPSMLAAGHLGAAPWLLRRWVDGVDVLRAGLSARREDRALGAGGVRLLELLRRIAGAFAALHRRGVLHGDVHPGNVLVDGRGEAWLIDLALARGLGEPLAVDAPHGGPSPAPPTRAGSLLAIEPEQARALLDGRGALRPTPRGEQFAVAALFYETACGVPYADFRLDRRGLLGQIADARPLPFADRDLDPWPGLETILRRALAADPADRFPDLDAFSEALERLPPQRPRRRTRRRLPAVARRLRRRLRLLARVDDGVGPSIYDGAAGVAYAQLRLAGQLERPSALAAAESWLDAAAARPQDAARRGRIAASSVFHGHAGVAVVDALLAHALADGRRVRRAIATFLERSRPDAPAELALGRAGSLLAASLLHRLEPDAHSRRALEQRAAAWARRLLDRLATGGAAGGPFAAPYWGLAHGVAGELYALLRWHRVRRRPAPAVLFDRLDQLAALARPRGRGRVWPQPAGGPLAGWCHGSAGYVLLWHEATRAAGESGEQRPARPYRQLAELAAWDAFEAPAGDGTLCCGLAGRAWSLLHHGRASGEEIWRHRAVALAEAASVADFPDPHTSLFKGELSLVLLDAELRGVEALDFPFFPAD